MNMRKTVIALGSALLLTLTGCGAKTQVNVEQASMLTTAVTSSDKFAGVVVSENVIEIERDTEQKLDELYVAVGDTVRVNEKLFEYDTDTLSLTVDKQQLEMDKLNQTIKDQTSQKTAIEKQIKDLEAKIKKEKNKTEKTNLQNQLATQQMRLQSANIELYKFIMGLDTYLNSVDETTILVVKADEYPFNVLTRYSQQMSVEGNDTVVSDLSYILSKLPEADRKALVDAVSALIAQNAARNGVELAG